MNLGDYVHPEDIDLIRERQDETKVVLAASTEDNITLGVLDTVDRVGHEFDATIVDETGGHFGILTDSSLMQTILDVEKSLLE